MSVSGTRTKWRKYLSEHTFRRVWRVASGAVQIIPTIESAYANIHCASGKECITFWCFFGPLPIFVVL